MPVSQAASQYVALRDAELFFDADCIHTHQVINLLCPQVSAHLTGQEIVGTLVVHKSVRVLTVSAVQCNMCAVG